MENILGYLALGVGFLFAYIGYKLLKYLDYDLDPDREEKPKQTN